jgi:hypothetical protein
MSGELWRRHRQEPFPVGHAAAEVAGINLALVDGEAAGCLETLYGSDQPLPRERVAILGLCARDLAIVVPHLNGEGAAYFRRLEQLVTEALREIAHRQLEA